MPHFYRLLLVEFLAARQVTQIQFAFQFTAALYFFLFDLKNAVRPRAILIK